jgi:hypothetical protein
MGIQTPPMPRDQTKFDRFQQTGLVRFAALRIFAAIVSWSIGTTVVLGSVDVHLVGVPDYGWEYGCMGTASGNLMGFWDRHGFPNFYTGPSNGGLAPLNNSIGNRGIISLWASQAGVDGRPADQPGHVDDYYVAYESTSPDPWIAAGRKEHSPDCLGDFIGMNQLKWTNLANECQGNIDGYCFVYWDTNGNKRVNFSPNPAAGEADRDVQSGLRAWTRYRGYDSTVFTQLAEFNPTVPPGNGFTFDDLRNEIDAGYPVLMLLQNPTQYCRTIGTATNVNPLIHSVLAYGYYISDAGVRFVRYMTSWASGPNVLSIWSGQPWQPQQVDLPVRGVIGYHPLPQFRTCTFSGSDLFLQWDGPASDLYNSTTSSTNRVHGYVVEMSTSLSPPNFSDVSPLLLTNTFTLVNCPNPAFFRLRLQKP